jgi:hypothetical protein
MEEFSGVGFFCCRGGDCQVFFCQKKKLFFFSPLLLRSNGEPNNLGFVRKKAIFLLAVTSAK